MELGEKEIRAKCLEMAVFLTKIRQEASPTRNCSHIDDVLYLAKVFENYIRNGE